MNKEEKEMAKELASILDNKCENTSFDFCIGARCHECIAKTLILLGYRAKIAKDDQHADPN